MAGVYGMNFESMPETGWPWAYPGFWLVCLTTVGVMLVLLYRKGGIGKQ